MLWTLVVFLICFMWLCCETDFLRVRLPVGKAKSNEYIECLTQMIDKEWIEVEKYLIIKPVIPQLAQVCELTRIQNELKNSGYYKRNTWSLLHNDFADSTQEMIIGKHKCRFVATNPNIHDLIVEVTKVQNTKHKPRQIQYHLSSLGHYYLDKETRFLSNAEPICGKEWLELHVKDEYPEPTIDLEVNGKEFHVNGNFKTGLIAGYMGKVKKSKQNKMIEV